MSFKNIRKMLSVEEVQKLTPLTDDFKKIISTDMDLNSLWKNSHTNKCNYEQNESGGLVVWQI